jgi:uncharacterized protein YlxW (UPF0749 family)
MTDEQPPPKPPPSGWSRLARMARPRATKANAFGALLAVVLGFALATQVRQTDEQGLEQLREDELVRILDDVTQDGERLDNELRELETQRERLATAGDNDEALRAAQERLDTLGVLAGTAPASGPGIVLTISDPEGKVTAAMLLDTLEELRDAGAEAVQIGGVRVVASSYFTDETAGIAISGELVSQPYTIRAIGDGATMAAAMDIPGGVTATIRGQGATAEVEQRETVEITALHSVKEPRYARPVPESSSGG